MATVKILTKPIREGKTCEIRVTGDGKVTVNITVGGKIVASKEVIPPVILMITPPAGSAGSSLRASTSGDFDSGFILAP